MPFSEVTVQIVSLSVPNGNWVSSTGGDHVGFVVGKTESGQLMVLGGNQSDVVNIKHSAQTALPVIADRQVCRWIIARYRLVMLRCQ